ncbi:kinase-like domain-containing protein [Phyllosticta capitalensis]|uniref:non-specific serine/threonine protein kinase n=1 Tax=Phyllosticta capitalensis TaxID=121624 RepID=A0ABR1YTT6_9PEZI
MSSRTDSEGEIHEHRVDKATSSAKPPSRGVSVDRQSRPRASVSLSPRGPYENGSQRHRSRSPYRPRSPRGEKRRRDDDFYSDRDRQDPRRFKVRYENRRPYEQERRNRVSYADLDRGDSSRPAPRYDDRDRNRYRGPRSRSPPPRPHLRGGQPDYRNGRHDSYDRRDYRRHDREKGADWRSREHSGTDRPPSRAEYHNGHGQDAPMRDAEPETAKPSEQQTQDEAPTQPEPEPVDEAALIEERRKRREAIKAKYKGQSTPLLVQALHLGNESSPATPQDESSDSRPPRSVSPMATSPATPTDGSNPGSPPDVQVQQDEDLANRRRVEDNPTDRDEPSAADYDPTADMNEDRARVEQQQHVRDAHQETEAQQNVQESSPKDQEAPKPKRKDEFDMFAEDDDDDMFAEEPASKPVTNQSESGKAPQVKKLDSSMLDVWDDHQGYYKVIQNELLDDRYEVQSKLGKGVFSEVVRARDVNTNTLVAIKIIRNDEILRKAGVKEIEMLEKLADHDPDDKRHCIRMLRWFDHKHHLCMVFEHLSVNLREVLKKFGRDVGLNLKAVRSYAQQMFVALSLLRKCNIVHADIKPDNMLVNDTRNVLKICDLGSAMDISECEVPAGLLVSRFYRAPEIMLGIPHDYGIDTWAIGCTLFELYTGKILFTGRDNNQMLRSIQECRGKMSIKLLKKGWADYVYEHFDENLSLFRSVETDKVTNKDVVRMVNFTKPTRDLKSRLIGSSKGLTDAELKEVNLFHDLLDKCLSLNPEKRITPYEALRHPFIHRVKP